MADFMSDLSALGATARQAELRFDEMATAHGFENCRWGFYRALDKGEKVPTEVMQAYETYWASCQAFYKLRDGERGFLGSRGA